MAQSTSGLTWDLIAQARERISGQVNLTPVLTSTTLDRATDARLYFKCENFQKGGAFKARGATNAVFALTQEQAQRGVVTHSSGNHGAALARAARARGIPARVVMPENAPQAKRDAVSRYGAEITWCAPTLAAREAAAQEIIRATGATLVHPYDDLLVMAGQGTVAVELLEQVPQLDVIMAPVGGGGLLSGIAVAAKHLKPDIRIVGVEPAGADDAARSLRAGHIVTDGPRATIADGLRGTIGEKPFAEVLRLVDDIVTVPDEAIVRAMRTVWEVLKIVIEPSAAVPCAALLAVPPPWRGKRVGVVVSGGNLDLERLPWNMARTAS